MKGEVLKSLSVKLRWGSDDEVSSHTTGVTGDCRDGPLPCSWNKQFLPMGNHRRSRTFASM